MSPLAIKFFLYTNDTADTGYSTCFKAVNPTFSTLKIKFIKGKERPGKDSTISRLGAQWAGLEWNGHKSENKASTGPKFDTSSGKE